MKARYVVATLAAAGLIALLNYAQWAGAPGGPSESPLLDLSRLPDAGEGPAPETAASDGWPAPGSYDDASGSRSQDADRRLAAIDWLVLNRTKMPNADTGAGVVYPAELLARHGQLVRLIGTAALRRSSKTGRIDGLLRPAKLEGCCDEECEHPLLQTVYVICGSRQDWPVASPIPLASVTGRLFLGGEGSLGYLYVLRDAAAEPIDLPRLDAP